MSLFDKISQDLIQAQKKRDTIRLSTLRMLKSDLKYKQIEKNSPLSEEEELVVLASAVKKHKDSIEQFRQAQRNDLVAQEEGELNIILEYLPKQLSEEELTDLIEQAIQEAGAVSKADLGKVMKILMPKVRGRSDGKLVSSLVTAKLS
ncbi:MAG: YqeY [candidate division Zixibacteria bacterium RBG-1]|nr:MAG: YqeY [candidate division Zixibacteria bacterium RBG-1]OGC85772.1 MAG: aspartyl-tRNA amidotransferase [candidate division Zixibacteria bacterium RBG_19FT_COMBO_42_43]